MHEQVNLSHDVVNQSHNAEDPSDKNGKKAGDGDANLSCDYGKDINDDGG